MKTMYQIGSVIEIKEKGDQVPLIIIGRLMQQSNGIVSDYIGLPYPYGYTGPKTFYSFNEEDINNVLHEGFKTEISNELQQFYQERSEELC